MKTGRTIQELAIELDRQAKSKRDFVSDTRELTMNGGQMLFMGGGDQSEQFGLTDHAHAQIASRLKIPKPYYDRLRKDHPQLLDGNVNTLFSREPERRMIRTLDGDARAFLSDRYRRLDNYDLMNAVMPVLAQAKDLQIVSCEVTDTRLYLKAIFPRMENEITRGDAVQAGIVISNSEIGAGSLRVEPLLYRLVCLNGMIAADSSTRKYHVGRANDAEAYELFSDDTMKADDKAVWLKVRDTVHAAAVDAKKFDAIVQRARQATAERIESPVKAVEQLASTVNLTEREKDSVLTRLIEGGDLSRWGVVNAVTRASQDVDDYDRATELERDGGRILTLPSNQWNEIAQAA